MQKTLFQATPKFEKTTRRTIAIEMGEYKWDFGREIDSTCMEQLIRVLNYAHDQGGRRVILINQTCYSSEQLLLQIKAQLPSSERERTWSRLMLLLCETEDSIFKYDQFNGHIENIIPDIHHAILEANKNKIGCQSISKFQLNFLKDMRKPGVKSNSNDIPQSEKGEKVSGIQKDIYSVKSFHNNMRNF
jgi:hypothetical protein